MTAAAEQLAPEQTPPEGVPPAELSDEEIFEQAFEERFGSDGGDEVPVDPAPNTGREPDHAAGDPPPQEGEDPIPPQAVDNEGSEDVPEWFNELPDEARAAISQLREAEARLQDQYTALHGRLAPVQQENARLRQQLETSQPATAGAARPTPPNALTSTETTPSLDLSEVEEFQEFEEAFPEEAKAIKAIFGRQAQHLNHLQGQLGEVSDGLRQVQTTSTNQERERSLAKLATAHPDWMTVRPSKDFEEWRATQPPSVARMADSPNPDECIYILDRYKQDVYLQRQLAGRDNPTPPAQQDNPETAAARATRDRRQQLRSVPGLDPQAGDVGVPLGDPDANLTDEDIWAQEVKRRLRAQRDNRR